MVRVKKSAAQLLAMKKKEKRESKNLVSQILIHFASSVPLSLAIYSISIYKEGAEIDREKPLSPRVTYANKMAGTSFPSAYSYFVPYVVKEKKGHSRGKIFAKYISPFFTCEKGSIYDSLKRKILESINLVFST